MLRVDVASAIARARTLAARPGIAMLGIAGAPGAGKSTLAARVAEAVPGAVLVGMDGFHLAHATLVELGRVDRKGAPDTFDAAGFVVLLRRIRGLDGLDHRSGLHRDEVVWAPRFHREIEDAVAGAVAVTSGVPLVVTEGNYLLLDDEPWTQVAGLLDECWYLDVDDDLRRTRLQARHEHHGRSPEEARERTWGSDERNAAVVAASRHRATVIVAADPG
ncbi:MAG TPA: nucleoside/nucleotide kinase family protein [Nocardioides sp.]|uniref:nucleoside/nucleotide kinase family protein n=1 Tax=Nocardioides sp. TaxID=35761 RepID=UPI002D80B3F0|nr:nucleoside/nucleotide kinase family protein [Nocardioides sp.]HET6653048.1 nucleoside/nucleotide kinase family protein [Nocardioides sp.]